MCILRSGLEEGLTPVTPVTRPRNLTSSESTSFSLSVYGPFTRGLSLLKCINSGEVYGVVNFTVDRPKILVSGARRKRDSEVKMSYRQVEKE